MFHVSSGASASASASVNVNASSSTSVRLPAVGSVLDAKRWRLRGLPANRRPQKPPTPDAGQIGDHGLHSLQVLVDASVSWC